MDKRTYKSDLSTDEEDSASKHGQAAHQKKRPVCPTRSRIPHIVPRGEEEHAQKILSVCS
jgi:hypothetical protein